MTTATAALSSSLRVTCIAPADCTRPVTHCHLCKEAIGDELVSSVEITDWARGVIRRVSFHPACYDTLVRRDAGRGMFPHPPVSDKWWRTCPWCGRRWGMSVGRWRYRPAEWSRPLCSDACRRASRRAEHRRAPGSCEVCDHPLIGRADSRYCSPACRQFAYRKRARSRPTGGTP